MRAVRAAGGEVPQVSQQARETARDKERKVRGKVGIIITITLLSGVGSGQTALFCVAGLLDLTPGMWWTGLIMSGLR